MNKHSFSKQNIMKIILILIFFSFCVFIFVLKSEMSITTFCIFISAFIKINALMG